MTQHADQTSSTEESDNPLANTGIARVLPAADLAKFDCFKWIALGINDFKNAKVISLTYGIIFALIPLGITYLIRESEFYMVVFPAMICFMLLGPYLAAGLYDVSWQFEKQHKPSLRHSFKAMSRNAVNEWGFGIMLMILMIFWLRVASLIHALNPNYSDTSLASIWPFLLIGTIVGGAFSVFVFVISVFTQPILLERKVDLATAVLSSMNAVWKNKEAMFVWACVILISILLGFFTAFIAFIFIMPVLGYATWHGYIQTIKTKRARKFV
ncbi:DUF2189 domain-containing protein [Glaciecola petra]|uniref:DUF2189 domain-containing protein n=1 Tax=Glaciecola petra TaxID=3075602 RepID=A0ABU2ZNW0_9ALTE|nr:DUF2189 domain-containing protein [Aestuariibacter sp. P117]MDT0594316.1 DUF2189 domain-containing protein [Aestuariibacter sp. P117]